MGYGRGCGCSEGQKLEVGASVEGVLLSGGRWGGLWGGYAIGLNSPRMMELDFRGSRRAVSKKNWSLSCFLTA